VKKASLRNYGVATDEISEVIAMCARASVLRMLVTASVMCALTAPASAAGMGGMSMGGMAVGMAAVGGPGAANSAMGAAGAANTYGNSVPGTRLPIGARDGPSGVSASSGHNPFGNSEASSAWASLPALDPDLPGVAAPGLPGLAKSGPSAPDVSVQVPAGADGLNNSSEVTSGSQDGSGALRQSSLSSKTSSVPRH
jgi:hypothetical protein